jgi:hypothetical protein
MTPRISAIAIGFFLGFIIPFVGYIFLSSFAMPSPGEEAPRLLGLFTIASLLVFVGAPLTAGYLSARIAKVQPLLHGCIVGMLGATLFLLMASPITAGLWAALVFVPGGIAGGWLWKVQEARRAL